MITQKIRILNNTHTVVLFDLAGLFSNMQLNSLSTVPSWITENLLSGKILTIELDPTSTGTSYIYYTLGGSPPTEDALLIIEVVESLTDTIDTCSKYQTLLVDSINNRDGYARINLFYELDIIPKVGEYVYIDAGIYSGYSMVKNVISDQNIVINKPYTTSVSPANCNMTYFGANTSKCIVWINREGGRSSYIFDQRKDYDGIIGDSKKFDNNGSIKYINRGKNYNYTTVYKSSISNTEVDLIESLRYSIQAWEFDINTNTATPIVIDSNSFAKYNTKNKLNNISLKYRISKYKIVQNQ